MAVPELPRSGALPAAAVHGRSGDLRPLAGAVVDEHPCVPRDRDDTRGPAQRCGRSDPRSAGSCGWNGRGPARLAPEPAAATAPSCSAASHA